MFKIFRKPESYGKTKLDHVLTYISYALRDACVTVGIVALMYMFFYFVNQSANYKCKNLSAVIILI